MKKLGRMVALILAFSLLLASSAFAATKASSQILKHSIDITANKGGEIAIEVSVTGNGLMKQIGVEKIKIYENGTTLVESLNKDDSGMSKKNATSYANTIYFDGETGTRYRVEVSVFAEDAGGDSDSRSKTVTLTAK